MKKYMRLTCYTLVANLLIIIGAGHGIAPIGLLEIAGFRYFYGIGTEDFSLSLLAGYDTSIGPAALFSLLGQLLLVVSFFIKAKNKFTAVIVAALVLLWTGFIYLVHSAFDNNKAAMFSFTTGLPFLVISCILLYRLVQDRKVHYQQS